MTEPFCRTPLALLDDARLDPYDTRVYETLWRCSDYRSHRTRPGTTITVIAQMAHMSRPTVIRSIRKLTQAGWLTAETGRSTQAPTYTLQSMPLTAVNAVDVSPVDCSQSTALTASVNGVDCNMGSEPNAGKGLPQAFRTISDNISESRRTPLTPRGGKPRKSTLSESKDDTPRTSSGPPPNAVTEIWEYYRDHIQPMARLTDGAKRKIATRLHTWSAEELRYAIDHFAANAWRMERNARLGAEWFFRSDDQIDRFRLLEPESATRNGYTNGHGQTRRNGSVLSVAQSTREEIYAARDRIRAEGGTPASSTVTGDDGVAQRRGRPGALEEMIQAQIAAQSATRQHPPEEATP